MATPRARPWCSHERAHDIATRARMVQPRARAWHSHARARGLFTARVYYWQTCPPHDTHHWLLHHVYKPWTLSQLAQVISGRSCSTFRCASSLSTFLEHLFQQDFFQFKVVFAAREGFIFVKPFSNWISHNLHLYLRQWILPCFHTYFRICFKNVILTGNI